MGSPELLALPQIRVQFKDNSAFTEENSSSYLFYFKSTCFKTCLELHIPESMLKLLRDKTCLNFLILRKGWGSVYENLKVTCYL